MRLHSSLCSRPRAGEIVSGDVAVVRTEGERSLLALVDALGHGPIANDIAQTAEASIRGVVLDAPVLDIMTALHEALRGTRGAAAMVCAIKGRSLEGCGVGNVELRGTGCEVPVMLSPGILGVAVRRYRVFQGSLRPSARLLLFTDGVTSRLSLDDYRALAAEEAARAIMAERAYTHDDATVLVVDMEE